MAVIVHLITGLETGGAERMLARLVMALDRERHRSIVVSMTGPGAVGPVLESAGIELHTLDMRRGTADLRSVARLTGTLRAAQPDILQTWLYHADLLGTVARLLSPDCALLWNVQCAESIDAEIVRRLLVWCSARPNAVVVNSLAGKRFHEQLGYRPRRWEHIPNGCDTNVFRFDPEARLRLRRELGIPDNAVAIGLPARFHPMKDHANFLAAAARLAAGRPDSVFVLVGPDVDHANPALAEMIRTHHIAGHVRLLGERSDMARIYSALDIATLSSAFGEGCPNVLGEAMSCGVPYVATDCGDAKDILGPTGIVVPPRNPEALAAAWERLISLGPDARRALGTQARDRIMRFYDLRAIIDRYDALYSGFVAQHSDERRARPARNLPAPLWKRPFPRGWF
jgi:glycosyltransferase involved in cell wall biosynthesis